MRDSTKISRYKRAVSKGVPMAVSLSVLLSFVHVSAGTESADRAARRLGIR